ncbi:hypothetical protein [Pseudolactococcus insecticola]|uniref:Uncharacterized protein n=1 Tax=Pseudolactococcus insecticola TaxID=2709158 RepID=A0A6A0B6B9_9LACT|nr:hypothetical protein [Lactococcus insecticola]GFH39854.1 hypothetical protein Hs20B_02520 [Lactococcus insecticola]
MAIEATQAQGKISQRYHKLYSGVSFFENDMIFLKRKADLHPEKFDLSRRATGIYENDWLGHDGNFADFQSFEHSFNKWFASLATNWTAHNAYRSYNVLDDFRRLLTFAGVEERLSRHNSVDNTDGAYMALSRAGDDAREITYKYKFDMQTVTQYMAYITQNTQLQTESVIDDADWSDDNINQLNAAKFLRWQLNRYFEMMKKDVWNQYSGTSKDYTTSEFNDTVHTTNNYGIMFFMEHGKRVTGALPDITGSAEDVFTDSNDMSPIDSVYTIDGSTPEYEAALAQYQADLAKYTADYAQYQADYAAYQAILSTLKQVAKGSGRHDVDLDAGQKVTYTGMTNLGQISVPGNSIEKNTALSLEEIRAIYPDDDIQSDYISYYMTKVGQYVWLRGVGKYAGGTFDVKATLKKMDNVDYIKIYGYDTFTTIIHGKPSPVSAEWEFAFVDSKTKEAISIELTGKIEDIDDEQEVNIAGVVSSGSYGFNSGATGTILSVTADGAIKSQNIDVEYTNNSNMVFQSPMTSTLSVKLYGGTNITVAVFSLFGISSEVVDEPIKPDKPTEPEKPASTTVRDINTDLWYAPFDLSEISFTSYGENDFVELTVVVPEGLAYQSKAEVIQLNTLGQKDGTTLALSPSVDSFKTYQIDGIYQSGVPDGHIAFINLVNDSKFRNNWTNHKLSIIGTDTWLNLDDLAYGRPQSNVDKIGLADVPFLVGTDLNYQHLRPYNAEADRQYLTPSPYHKQLTSPKVGSLNRVKYRGRGFKLKNDVNTVTLGTTIMKQPPPLNISTQWFDIHGGFDNTGPYRNVILGGSPNATMYGNIPLGTAHANGVGQGIGFEVINNALTIRMNLVGYSVDDAGNYNKDSNYVHYGGTYDYKIRLEWLKGSTYTSFYDQVVFSHDGSQDWDLAYKGNWLRTAQNSQWSKSGITIPDGVTKVRATIYGTNATMVQSTEYSVTPYKPAEPVKVPLSIDMSDYDITLGVIAREIRHL